MDWKGKRVVIVGAARQGTALAAYLAKGGAKIALCDARPAEHFVGARERLDGLNITWHFGEQPSGILKGAKALFLSGGVSPDIPLAQEARRRGIPLSNDSQLFLEQVPCPVIGITGSAGKTTTTILAARMLKTMYQGTDKRIWLGGNIGNPLISVLDQIGEQDLAVMELSSFQLELMQRSPQVALMLNLAPNHLDRHLTMADYVAAKARILDFQQEKDLAVLGRDDFGAWAMLERVKGRLWSFGRRELDSDQMGSYVRGKDIWLRDAEADRKIMPLSAIELRGEHNLLNVLAACAAAAAVGASPQAMQAGVEGFRGAPHRLEWVRSVNGVDWYNDSIATSPQRGIAALGSFQRRVVLLVGGRDKGLPWDEYAALAKDRARRVLTFGESAEMLHELFSAAVQEEIPVDQHGALHEVVAAAAKLADKGDVVLLAPGGTSYDEFEDFEARGLRFRELVADL